MFGTFRQLLAIAVLTILAILLVGYLKSFLELLVSLNNYLFEGIHSIIPVQGRTVLAVVQSLPIIFITLSVGFVVALVFYPVNSRIPGFVMPVVWGIWLVLIIAVTLFR